MVHAASSNRSTVPVCKSDILASTIHSLNPTELLRDVCRDSSKALESTRSVLLPKLSGLVMMLWRYRSCERRSLTNGLTFSLPIWKIIDEPSEVVQVLTLSQLVTTATITDSMSLCKLPQSNHQCLLLEAAV